MISFDTEDNGKGEMNLAVFFDGKDYRIFDRKNFSDVDKMKLAIIKYIFEAKDNLFVAHNLEYDLANIFYPRLFYLKMYYSTSLIFARLANTRKKFIDSFLFSFSSLKEVGRTLGLEKKKIENDDFYNVEYCKRDAEIVHRYLDQFQRSIKAEFGLKIKSTLAGTAHSIFLKRFCRYDLDNNKNPELLNAYMGGRVEVFNVGKEKDIYEIDVNSMYPYVMLTNKFPTEECYETIKPEEEDYISEIIVSINSDVIFPIIPLRRKKLYFPVGTFRTWVTSAELKKAILEGQVKDIQYLRTFNFPSMHYIFVNFVDYFYKKRLKFKKNENDSYSRFYSQFYKLILNSTYGRFALRNDLHVLKYKSDAKGEFADLSVEFEKCNFETKGINYAIPAYVTSYARVQLYQLIKKVYDAGRKPIYCDTDSVYFSGGIISDLPINNDLGGLSIEHYDYGEFYGAKAYWCTKNNVKKIKCKGIPEKMREEYFEKGVVSYKRPKRLRSALRSKDNVIPNTWLDFTMVKNDIYDKRDKSEGLLINTRPKVIIE